MLSSVTSVWVDLPRRSCYLLLHIECDDIDVYAFSLRHFITGDVRMRRLMIYTTVIISAGLRGCGYVCCSALDADEIF